MEFPEGPRVARAARDKRLIEVANSRRARRFLKKTNFVPSLVDARSAFDRAGLLDEAIHEIGDVADQNNLNRKSTYAEAVFGGTPYAQRYLSTTHLVPDYLAEVYGTILGRRVRPTNCCNSFKNS